MSENNKGKQEVNQDKKQQTNDWFDQKIAKYRSPKHTFDLNKILSEGPEMTKEQAQ